MATIPLPALAITQPPDPVSQLGKVVSLQNMMQEQQLRQGQGQLQQQQLQEGDLQLQSRKAIMRAFNESPDDPNAMLKLAGQYGASPNDILGLQQHFADVRSKAAQTEETTLKNTQTKHDVARSLLSGVLQAPPDQQPQLYQQAYAQARDQHLLDDLPQGAVPAEYPGADALQRFNNSLTLTGSLIKEGLEQKQAEEAAAKIPGEKAQSFIEQTKADAIKNATPEAFGNLVDQVVPRNQSYSGLNTRTHAMVNNALQMGDVEGARNEIAKAAEQIGSIEKETNPAVINARIQAGVGTEVGKLQAQQKMFPSPTVGVAPHLVGPATAAAQKAGADYVQAQNAAQEMQSMVDLMRQGNKVAYNYSPVTGVLTINSANGTKRINMAEIEQYGGAGSLLDNIKGWVGKKVEGEGIPDNIVNDMEQLHGQLAANSADSYKKNLAVVNGVYGAQFQPVTLPQNSAPAVGNKNNQSQTSGLQVGQKVTLKNGNTVTVKAVHPDGSFDAN